MSVTVLWWLYGLTALTKGDYLNLSSSSSDYQFDDQLFSFRFRETCFYFYLSDTADTADTAKYIEHRVRVKDDLLMAKLDIMHHLLT